MLSAPAYPLANSRRGISIVRTMPFSKYRLDCECRVYLLRRLDRPFESPGREHELLARPLLRFRKIPLSRPCVVRCSVRQPVQSVCLGWAAFEARKAYGRAVSALATALQDPVEATKDSTLAALHLVSLHEVISPMLLYESVIMVVGNR